MGKESDLFLRASKFDIFLYQFPFKAIKNYYFTLTERKADNYLRFEKVSCITETFSNLNFNKKVNQSLKGIRFFLSKIELYFLKTT